MLVTHEREKLLNALIYYSENVLYPGKTKLFKLLHFLDFLHYKNTGRSVTGLDYFAWARGPVPKELYNEWDKPKPDFIEHLAKKSERFPNGTIRKRIVKRKKFDPSWFSPYELELMEAIAKEHFSKNADEISERSHFETEPWHEVWEVRGNKKGEIPYKLVLERQGSKEDMEVLDKAKEYREIQKNHA